VRQQASVIEVDLGRFDRSLADIAGPNAQGLIQVRGLEQGQIAWLSQTPFHPFEAQIICLEIGSKIATFLCELRNLG
jgi:hypothetical protein